MTDKVQCVVIGAGVIGLACAQATSEIGLETLILEAEKHFGTQTSSRNSEVIHAGIHYAPGSKKAKLCKPGRDMLYKYCLENGIAHKKIGKLIVATNENQLPKLDKILKCGYDNDVKDLVSLSPRDVHKLEPEVKCVGAIWSPSTGIIDSHALMLSYLGFAQKNNAILSLQSPVQSGKIEDKGFLVEVGGTSPIKIQCDYLINAAGFFAQNIAHQIHGIPLDSIPQTYLARGSYYTLGGKSPFRHLVYPIPNASGLGVHVTIDLEGGVKFGPDVEWINTVDYSVNLAAKRQFLSQIQKYWPNIDERKLCPGYAGIRPRVYPIGGPETDFIIQGHEVHGIKGLINLYGIESPGLTSSLAIADEVVSLLKIH